MTEMTQASTTAETLDFKSDKGASRSFWVALILTVLIVGWMGSGFVLPSEPQEEKHKTKEKIPAPHNLNTTNKIRH